MAAVRAGEPPPDPRLGKHPLWLGVDELRALTIALELARLRGIIPATRDTAELAHEVEKYAARVWREST